MDIRYLSLYAVISASMKRKYLRTGLVKGVRSIDPRTGTYEQDILNGFRTLGDAKALARMLRGQGYKVSVIGVTVPEACILGGRPEGYTMDKYVNAQLAAQQCGYGNYAECYLDGNRQAVHYVVVSDLCSLSGIFDPLVSRCSTAVPAPGNQAAAPKAAPAQQAAALKTAPKAALEHAAAPKAAAGGIRPPVTGEPSGGVWAGRLLWLAAGILTGLAMSGIADRAPIAAGLLALSVMAAACLGILYRFTGR